MTAQTMQIGNRPCRIYGEAHAEYLLLQMTGEHEQQSMDHEVAAIRWQGCLLCGHPPRQSCSTVSPPPRPLFGFRAGWSLNSSARYRHSAFI